MNEAECRRVVTARSHGLCELALPGCLGMAHSKSHRKSKAQGGQWTPANILDACGDGTTGCHGWLELHPEIGRSLGLRVRRKGDPLTVPVQMAYRGTMGRWLLDDVGQARRADDARLGAAAAAVS